jgi:hypothetical protein
MVPDTTRTKLVSNVAIAFCTTDCLSLVLSGQATGISKAGWSLGCVSAIDSNGRTIWIADAHRDDGKRFVVHADEKLIAFMELESAIRGRDEFT